MRRLQIDLGPHAAQLDRVSRMLAAYSGLRELRLSADWSNVVARGVCDVVAECAAMKSGALRYVRLPLFDDPLFSCPLPAAAATAATTATASSRTFVAAGPLSSSSSSSTDTATDPDSSSSSSSAAATLEVGADALFWYTDARDLFAFVPVADGAGVTCALDDPERAVRSAATAQDRTAPISHVQVPTRRRAAHARTVHVLVRDRSLAAIMRRGTCVAAFSATDRSSVSADLWPDREAPHVGATTCVGGRAPRRVDERDGGGGDDHNEYRRRHDPAYACLCVIPRRRWRKQYADGTELLSMLWIGGRTTEADVESDDDSIDEEDEEGKEEDDGDEE
jgi:hypothetical protein